MGADSVCRPDPDGIPIVVRLLNNKRFEPGPFYLGTAGVVIGWIAVAWITTITVRVVVGWGWCTPRQSRQRLAAA